VDHRPGADLEAMLRDREESAAGPRGSYLAYRPDVWHRAVNLTEPGGARFVMSVSFKLAGHDWVGHDALQPRSTSPAFRQFVAGSTPRELELFGIPAPGHPYWTESTVQAMSIRYPGLEIEPWRAALPG
jgi:hypothetical protein